jgi:hypothetical protein
MPGIPEPDPNARYDIEHLAVFDPPHLPHDHLAFGKRVQRLDAFACLAALVLGVALLQVRSIGQQDRHQFAARLLCMNRAAKPALDQ